MHDFLTLILSIAPFAFLLLGAVSVDYAAKVNITETVANNSTYLNTNQNSLLYSGMSSSGTLTASTTPPVSLAASFQQALSGAAATIDLTALTSTNGATVSFNGKKVQIAKFRNLVTNANSITIKFGAANPYNLLGASWQIVLQPGDEIQFDSLSGLAPTVGGSAKNIDLSGTGSQVLEVTLVAG